jgi:hypothetical protein
MVWFQSPIVGDREISVASRTMPLNGVLNIASSLLGDGCNTVTKRMESGAVRFDFTCDRGSFHVSVSRRADGLHQVVRMGAREEKNTRTITYEAVAPQGDRLEVRPIMLAELHRGSPLLGRVLARLLQSQVEADGRTNYLDVVQGRLAQLAKAA